MQGSPGRQQEQQPEPECPEEQNAGATYARRVHDLQSSEPHGWLEHELEWHGAKPQLRIFAAAPTSAGSPRAAQPPLAAASEVAPPPPSPQQG